MIKKTFDDYARGFKYYIPLIILTVIVGILDESSIVKGTTTYFKMWYLISMLIALLLETYGVLIAKKIVRMEDINQKENIKETFKLYPKMLGIAVLTLICLIPIIMLLHLLATVGISGLIIFIITMITIAVYISCLIPSAIYYDDQGFTGCFSKAITVVKNNGWKILGFILLIVACSEGLLFVVNLIGKGWRFYSIIEIIINTIIYNMPVIYVMNILNRDEESKKDEEENINVIDYDR